MTRCAVSKTAYYWDAVSLEHDTGMHVESIARAERLSPDHIRRLLIDLNARPLIEHDEERWIARVHSKTYRDWVKESCRTGRRLLDQGDTVVCPRSYDAALGSVRAALTACDAVIAGEVASAFCAMRPPGHHALPGSAMGFCLFANISIAAKYLQEQHRIERIAVIDWDVHHGNGTQAIFYEDPTVFFVSLHQHPLWPGTGMADERGCGDGRGFTLNIPIAPATSELDYLDVFRTQVVPAVRNFKPEFVLISAGFDAHRDDPLGGLMLTEQGFASLTREVRRIADEFADGRIVSLLEGGYNLTALEASVAAHVRALAAAY